MPSRALLVADAGDPLAKGLQDRLPGMFLCPTPESAPFAFTLGHDGRLGGGGFQLEGTWIAWQDVHGLVFRPGHAWALPRRPRSTSQVFAFHEWCTAWCALLAAFPGPVVDRLPPGWFLDRRRQLAMWTHELSSTLGLPYARGARAAASALLVGTQVLAVDRHPEGRAWRAWLRRHRSAVTDWQHAAGLQCVRVDAVRQASGWALCSVDPVPPAKTMDSLQVAAWAGALCRLLEK